MKIAVHAQVLSEKNLPGIGYYTYHLLDALLKVDKKNEYDLISQSPLSHHFVHENVSHTCIPRQRGFSYFGFPRTAKQLGCDLAFYPKEVVPFGSKMPVVVSAFDLYYLKCGTAIRKEVPFSALLHYLLAAKVHLRRAKKVLAISEDTKQDLMEIAKVPEEKIVVTPLGYDPELFKKYSLPELEGIKAKYNLQRPYFINTSSLWWARKNILRLIEAFALFKKESKDPYQLVITGKKGPSYNEMLSLIRKHHMQNDVLLFEYVPRIDLPLLLQASHGLVFPSLHEGFGLPIIEAMGVGCPVVTSNVSATLEVAQGAALLVDPFSVDEIQEAMSKFSQESIRNKFCEKGLTRSKEFSWEKTARKTLEAWESL